MPRPHLFSSLSQTCGRPDKLSLEQTPKEKKGSRPAASYKDQNAHLEEPVLLEQLKQQGNLALEKHNCSSRVSDQVPGPVLDTAPNTEEMGMPYLVEFPVGR